MSYPQQYYAFGESLPAPRNLLEDDYQGMTVDLLNIYRAAPRRSSPAARRVSTTTPTWVHQIKTPIAAMRMILQGGGHKGKPRAVSGAVPHRAVCRNGFVNYFRLDASSTDFVFQSYSLDAIIRQAVHKYAPQFVRKRIRLEYAGTDATALTDEKWLLFILEQLLSNAIKYTKQGTVESVSTKINSLQ